MPRTKRAALGGYVYHVLNRGAGRMRLFDKAREYEAFEEILGETVAKVRLRVCALSVMPNHGDFRAHPASEMPDHVAAALRDAGTGLLEPARCEATGYDAEGRVPSN